MQHTISGHQRLFSWGSNGTNLIHSFQHLAHLLEAGVGLGSALEELMVQGRSLRRNPWARIAQRVNQGHALSSAMAENPATFDTRVIALIRAGESSGELAQACHGCERLLQWQASIQSRLVTVLVYPVFALLILIAVMLFLMVSVVPVMGAFLESSAGELSWHARLLIALSDWFIANTLLLPALALLGLTVWVGCRTVSEPFRKWTSNIALRLPLTGKLMIDLELSRYASTCAHLYGAGTSLSDSMRISEGVISSRELRRVLQHSRELMISGESLSASLESALILPSMFKRIVSAGESAGVLEKALMTVSEQQQRQTDIALERSEKLIGPVLLVVMGAVLLWMIHSLLGPVYLSAINSVVTP